MNLISTAMAQAPDAAANRQPGILDMFLPLGLIFGIFYFLILRPQQKQQKLRTQMIANLKRGDEVITNGGIYGKVTDMTDQTLMVQIANNVVIKLDRSQVSVVTNPEPKKD